MFARNTMSLRVKYVRKFVGTEDCSTLPVTTATKSVETDALRHAKWNTGINAKDHLVNAYTKEISSFNSTAFINRTY